MTTGHDFIAVKDQHKVNSWCHGEYRLDAVADQLMAEGDMPTTHSDANADTDGGIRMGRPVS